MSRFTVVLSGPVCSGACILESVRYRHCRTAQKPIRRALLVAALVGLAVALNAMPGALANGQTRTITFYHTHTQESATVTFKRNGEYDDEALKQLNWLLRDWRKEETANMDPLLFDIIWEIREATGSREPVHVISAYRSPETNGMLRMRSRAVSEHSLHMAGKAMDIRLPDVDTAQLRAVAMRLQYGGVGYYSSSTFVHVDTGSVRAWPRMSQDQLARLFPDGKTLHLPAKGKPLAGYEEAKVEILARNATLAQAAAGASHVSLGGFLARLLGGGNRTPATLAGSAPPDPVVTVAQAEPEVVDSPQPLAFAPLPPSRPRDLPVAREMTAGIWPGATAPLKANLQRIADMTPDEQSVLRTLFARVVDKMALRSSPRIVMARVQTRQTWANDIDLRPTGLDLSFKSRPSGDLSVARFSGPAVKPLPVLRQAQVGF